MHKRLLPWALLLLVLGFSAGSGAQTPERVQEILTKTAEALGMKRGPDQRRTLDPITRALFVGTGTMSELGDDGKWRKFTLSKYRQDINYRLPAIRQHLTRTNTEGKEETLYRVAREQYAWDEAQFGTGVTVRANDLAADRLRMIWVLPHGFWAAVVRSDPANVNFEQLGESGQIKVTTTINGEKATAILGEDYRPQQIDIQFNHPKLGNTTLSGKYSNYKDFNYYEVYFPEQMAITLAGQTVLQLKVTDHHNGGYLVWPLPDAYKDSPSR